MSRMNHDRRTLLKAIAALSIGSPLGCALNAATGVTVAAEPLIIDTHQHLWDRSVPALATATQPTAGQPRYSSVEYIAATKGLNVKAVYMEVDVAPELKVVEAASVIELCHSHTSPTLAAVIGGRPELPAFAEYIHRFSTEKAIRGVRQVLHSPLTPSGLCLKNDFVAGVRLLGKLDLSFDLCMRATELQDGLKLSELAPETRFVLDHCGNADPIAFMVAPPTGSRPSHDADTWRRDIEKLAARPNVICKISGIVARAPEHWQAQHLAQIVNHCLDSFGPDRVIFGGDWPICLKRASLRAWVDALRQIVGNRPAEDQAKLWSGNAKRFYGLDI